MTDESKDRSFFRRILLALDATTGPASLEAAVELAARLKAEVVALFVEDEEVIEAADNPHSRHISFPTGEYERVSGSTLARQFRTIAERVEQRLQRATRRLGVRISFQIVRGVAHTELESRAQDADLIFLDRGSLGFGPSSLASGTAGGLIERSSRPLLIWRAPSGYHGPVLAVIGWGDEAARLLEGADRLMGEPDRELIVALDVDDEAHRLELREECGRWLERSGRRAAFLRFDRGEARQLEQAVRSLGIELVVVSADRSRGSSVLAEWLEITERPVFLVR